MNTKQITARTDKARKMLIAATEHVCESRSEALRATLIAANAAVDYAARCVWAGLDGQPGLDAAEAFKREVVAEIEWRAECRAAGSAPVRARRDSFANEIVAVGCGNGVL